MKHFELSEENQELINGIWQELNYDNFMQLKLIGTPKAKELIKITKNGDIAKYLGNIPDDTVDIIIYEEAFDRLDEDAKKLLVRDAMDGIVYDTEKEKITIGVPSIVVTVGGRQKYGDKLLNAAEAGVLAIQQIEDEKREIKEAEKEKKAAERAAKKRNG